MSLENTHAASAEQRRATASRAKRNPPMPQKRSMNLTGLRLVSCPLIWCMLEMTLLKYHLVCNAGFLNLRQRWPVPKKYSALGKAIKKRKVQIRSGVPCKLAVLHEIPSGIRSEPPRCSLSRKLHGADSIALRNCSSSFPIFLAKWSAARFHGTERRKRFVAKIASCFQFHFLSFPVSPPIQAHRKRECIFAPEP